MSSFGLQLPSPRVGLTLLLACTLTPAVFHVLAEESPKSPDHRLSSLEWLAGDWISETPEEIVEEHWMAPRGGMMLGMNRTVTRKGKVSFEYLRIEDKDGGLTLLASPSGSPATPFRAIEVSKTRVTFENRRVEFPQQIHYWIENDLLRAKIEGTINGSSQSQEWTWKRRTAASR